MRPSTEIARATPIRAHRPQAGTLRAHPLPFCYRMERRAPPAQAKPPPGKRDHGAAHGPCRQKST
ncbi:hypothetical protein GCM10027317_34510 [Massilia agri]